MTKSHKFKQQPTPSYADWSPQRVDIIDLQLDPLNPRIPALGDKLSERAIIEQLLQHENVLDLARDIGNQGFFPTEVLVCIEEKRELIVVEGNRRLASLKLLTSPELAPDSQQERFRLLRTSYNGSIPEKINVVVAPSRKSTIPLIMNKHTRLGVKSWEPLQQAQYVTSLLNEGLGLETLPDLTGIPRAEILKNLRTNSLYDMAKRLPLNEGTREIVRDPRKFSASTLERVSGSPDFRKFLGIDFDEIGGVVGKVHPDEFKSAYSYIVAEIAHKRADTRTLNDAKSIKKYIRSIAKVKPDPAKKGTFTSKDFLVEETLSVRSTPTPKVKSSKKRTQSSLIARGFPCNISMERIKTVLWELQHLKVSDYENAVGILVRIFIELATSNYMQQTGQMKELIDNVNKGAKQPKSSDWTPTLRQMLGHLMAKDEDLKKSLPRQAIKAINKAIADDDYQLSLDGMDQFAHNPYVSPNERQLRQLWNAFEKYVEFMMEDHKPLSKAAKS